jgi:hypothetical protein
MADDAARRSRDSSTERATSRDCRFRSDPHSPPRGRKRLLSPRTDDLETRFHGLLDAVLAAKRRRAKSAA